MSLLVSRLVILHLGGDPKRIHTTIAYAIASPGARIIISSETQPQVVLAALKDAGISLGRVTFDFRAWDTVSNYTATFGLVLSHRPRYLIPVTGRSHMEHRAGDLARLIYVGTGVEVIEGAHEPEASPVRPSRWQRRWDLARAWLWCHTGVLLYNPFTRWRAMRTWIRPAARDYAALTASREEPSR